MDRKVIHIRENELANACDDLEPTLAVIYDKYGLEITVMALQFLSAKAIVFSGELTPSQEDSIVKQSASKLKKFTALLRNYLTSGS